jgi:hypothetical protein
MDTKFFRSRKVAVEYRYILFSFLLLLVQL